VDIIILAGGFGTRLQSISNNTPKALMQIGETIYLDLLLVKVFKYNINHVYLSLHYKPELFEKFIFNSPFKNKLSIFVEPEPLGTGGAVNYVIKNSSISSFFFVMNGDSMSNINFNKMYESFIAQNLTAMIGISKVEDSERYGTVLSKDGKVMSFEEKGVTGSGWINNGHYIFKKQSKLKRSASLGILIS
jgi:D-glycero-alpha-D-manno-heptose 1-phosphate guanylyltransferase